MNCCYCGDLSISPSAATWQAALGEPACSTSPASYRGCYLAYFSFLWLQPAPSMHWGHAPFKAMQVHQILIQIPVMAGFTPMASIAQFSPFPPSPLLHRFLLPCIACMLASVAQCLPCRKAQLRVMLSLV